MRIDEILTESPVDDQLIIKTARATIDNMIATGQGSTYLKVPSIGIKFDAAYDAYFENPTAETKKTYQEALFRKHLGQVMVKAQQDKRRPGSHGSFNVREHTHTIQINPNYINNLLDPNGDQDHARSELMTVLTHEIRHAVDYYKTKSYQSDRYYKPHVPDEPDSTQSEINAYFTELLHGVERDIKNANMPLNRALRYGQEALQDSHLVDVTFGGWDNTNPVLRRLSNRMSQFVHILFQPVDANQQ